MSARGGSARRWQRYLVLVVILWAERAASAAPGDVTPRASDLTQRASDLAQGASELTHGTPLSLTPFVVLAEEYNDNVFFTSQKVTDYITLVTPGIHVGYIGQTLSLDASLAGTARYFARGTVSSNFSLLDNQGGQLGTTYQATPRLSFAVYDYVRRVERTRTGIGVGTNLQPGVSGEVTTPAQQPLPADPTNSVLPRGSVVTNTFTVSANYLLTPLWTTSVTFRNGLGNFTDPGAQDLTNSAILQLSNQWSEILTFSGAYSYSRFGVNSGTDTESHAITFGGGLQWSPTIALGATGGVFVNRALGGGADSISNRTGFTYSVTASKLFESSSFGLGANEQITPSAGIAGASDTRTEFAQYAIELPWKLYGSLAGSLRQFNTSATDFSVMLASAGLSYPLTPTISAGLFYSYRWLHASQGVSGVLDQGTVDGNSVLLSVRFSYPLLENPAARGLGTPPYPGVPYL